MVMELDETPNINAQSFRNIEFNNGSVIKNKADQLETFWNKINDNI